MGSSRVAARLTGVVMAALVGGGLAAVVTARLPMTYQKEKELWLPNVRLP